MKLCVQANIRQLETRRVKSDHVYRHTNVLQIKLSRNSFKAKQQISVSVMVGTNQLAQ